MGFEDISMRKQSEVANKSYISLALQLLGFTISRLLQRGAEKSVYIRKAVNSKSCASSYWPIACLFDGHYESIALRLRREFPNLQSEPQ